MPGFRVADRDDNVQDFLDTARFPIGRFIAGSAALPGNVASGQAVSLTVSGTIEVKGVSRPATAVMDVRYQAGAISAAGSTLVVAENHGIELPKAGDFVAVDSNITVEFALSFARAG